MKKSMVQAKDGLGCRLESDRGEEGRAWED